MKGTAAGVQAGGGTFFESVVTVMVCRNLTCPRTLDGDCRTAWSVTPHAINRKSSCGPSSSASSIRAARYATVCRHSADCSTMIRIAGAFSLACCSHRRPTGGTRT